MCAKTRYLTLRRASVDNMVAPCRGSKAKDKMSSKYLTQLQGAVHLKEPRALLLLLQCKG